MFSFSLVRLDWSLVRLDSHLSTLLVLTLLPTMLETKVDDGRVPRYFYDLQKCSQKLSHKLKRGNSLIQNERERLVISHFRVRALKPLYI